MELVPLKIESKLNCNQYEKRRTRTDHIIYKYDHQSHLVFKSFVNSHYHFLTKFLNYAIIYLLLVLIHQVNGKSNSNSNGNSCVGRVKLTQSQGFITDGKNVNYNPDLQCTWLIDASEYKVETLIRLKFTEFETECNWDHLYIFSGDSVFSPLVAAFSGVLMKRGQNLNELPELEIRSKQVYLYFYSDTAYNLTGFNLTYSIHPCIDNDCSKATLARPLSVNLENNNLDFNNNLTLTDHCSTNQLYSNYSNCNCNDGLDHLVCSMQVCPNKCSHGHGECDLKEKKCNCKPDYSGADCGEIRNEGYWEALNTLKDQKVLGRALHASVLIDDKMWIVGGEFFKKQEAQEQFVMNFDLKKSRWNIIEKQTLNLKRFSHSLVHYNQSLYMYGGILDNGTISNELWRFDIEQSKWKLVEIDYKQDQCTLIDYCAPLPATGHSATVVDDRMFVIFGYSPKYGYLNTVQEFRFNLRAWSLLNPGGALVKGGFGHSSVYFPETKTIYVFGGHHSFITDSNLVDYLYAYLPYKNKWQLLTSSKSPRYFHSAAIINNQMYIYGGNALYNSSVDNNNYKCFSTQFLVYNIACDTWNSLSEPSDMILNNFGTGRFGHTSIVYNDQMYIFGGFNGIMLNNMLRYIPPSCSNLKTKNDCCKLVFTLNCVWDSEKKLCMEFNEEMTLLNNRINTALSTNTSKKNYILGTSDSVPLNDFNTFCHPNFDVYSIDRPNSSNSNSSTDYSLRSKCPIKFSNNNEACKKQTNCPSCLENSYNCVWCDDACYSEKCKKNSKRQSRDLMSCDADDTSTLQFNCQKFHNCASCHTNPYCTFHMNNMCFPFVERTLNRTVKAVLHDNLRPPCDPVCSLQTSCENCTLSSCMWCSSLNRCIESNSYSAIFPLAQCSEWTIHPSKCSILSCATQGSCEQCQKIHRCGWCDDGSGTGSGYCLEGHSRGPILSNNNIDSLINANTSTSNRPSDKYNNNSNKHLSDVTNRLMNLDSNFLNKNNVNIFDLLSVNKPNKLISSQSKQTCKADKWYFTECPICQCNGHSQCKPGTSICNKPCLHDTEGEHCEECKSGFYGSSINGGRCFPCKCNNHSIPCDKRTGRCFCTTKGIVGNYCERCDEQNHYFGNPNLKDSTCFYNLSIDFQYTFNMSKSDDRHFNKINFMNMPHRPDLDVDFTITCSNKGALFNISFGSATLPHRILQERVECGQYKYRFSHHDFLFGAENSSFYVNVYSFSYPFILQISFSQHRALDLIQFFVTFSSCFLTLLILAAILWKIKQKYDHYRRQQQFFMELEHLASRPFSGIVLEIPGSTVKNSSTSPMTTLSNDELNTQTLPPSTVKQQSKLKAFTSAPRSHLKNFLNSNISSSNNNLSVGEPKSTNNVNNDNVENPTPIAFEPCMNNKAAVLSLIVRMPTGGTGVIPIGQTGIAIASALVSLGTVDQKTYSDKNTSSTKKSNNPAFV